MCKATSVNHSGPNFLLDQNDSCVCRLYGGDPTRFPELLAAHAKTAELASG